MCAKILTVGTKDSFTSPDGHLIKTNHKTSKDLGLSCFLVKVKFFSFVVVHNRYTLSDHLH